ncbi:MAG: hypothetical protein FVQ82_09570 [Planctomycetes bacterium]|nr:hypothetical protein [Planctomycetota bacterium]
MNIPTIENPNKYTGLYVVDFGETSSVGFTAVEVAELLESEKYADIKVYKIHGAYPDGKMELKGVPSGIFQLEMGMFFYAGTESTSEKEYDNLVALAETTLPPCRAKVELAKITDDLYTTAIIYPAEYNDEVSSWLIEIDYSTSGAAAGGIEAVTSFNEQKTKTIQSHQLHAADAYKNKTGEELLSVAKQAIQR